MKVINSNNRTSVTFNIEGIGGDLVNKINLVHKICIKYNAQEHLFSNRAPYSILSKSHNLFGTKIYAIEMFGNTGGTITFHNHSCDNITASKELIDLLLSFGMQIPKYFTEVIKTHRNDGTKYKKPQLFIEEI